MRRLLALAASLLLAVSLAACGDDDDDGDASASLDEMTEETEDTTEETTATTVADEYGAPATGNDEAVDGDATVSLGETELGEVLVDAGGMTLYLFTNDTGGASACTGGCAATWPPLTVEGEPLAGDGIDQSLLGTITRDDGSTQVTYNGHPLYTYASDTAPGDTNGQGVGDVWWVVGADGEPIS